MFYIVNASGKDCYFYYNNNTPYWKYKIRFVVPKDSFYISEQNVQLFENNPENAFFKIGSDGKFLPLLEFSDSSEKDLKFLLKIS